MSEEQPQSEVDVAALIARLDEVEGQFNANLEKATKRANRQAADRRAEVSDLRQRIAQVLELDTPPTDNDSAIAQLTSELEATRRELALTKQRQAFDLRANEKNIPAEVAWRFLSHGDGLEFDPEKKGWEKRVDRALDGLLSDYPQFTADNPPQVTETVAVDEFPQSSVPPPPPAATSVLTPEQFRGKDPRDVMRYLDQLETQNAAGSVPQF